MKLNASSLVADGFHPHILAVVVDDQQEVFVAAESRWRYGAAEVTMDELESALCVVRRHAWERCPVLLADDAPLAELLHA
jgi:hypothetical protein